MKLTGGTYAQALRRLRVAEDSVRTALGKDLEQSLRDARTSD
jgi:hypothetical protein